MAESGGPLLSRLEEWLTYQHDEVESAMKLTVSWGLPCTDVPHTDLSNSGDVDCPFTDEMAN